MAYDDRLSDKTIKQCDYENVDYSTVTVSHTSTKSIAGYNLRTGNFSEGLIPLIETGIEIYPNSQQYDALVLKRHGEASSKQAVLLSKNWKQPYVFRRPRSQSGRFS